MSVYLAGVADARIFKNDELFATAKTLVDSSISIGVSAEDIRAGKGAKLYGKYFHTSTFDLKMTDAMFKLEYLAANVGAELQLDGDVFTHETKKYIGDNNIDLLSLEDNKKIYISDYENGSFKKNDNYIQTNVINDKTISLTDALVGEDLINCKIYNNGKNLIPYPYLRTTQVKNGITFTDNGDGTITVNGTATAYTEFKLCWFTAKKGKYYFISGCPKRGSDSTYYLHMRGYDHDVGAGASFLCTHDFTNTIDIVINKGTAVDNLIFKPQLEYGSTATEYEKYKAVGNLSSTDNKYHIPIQVCGKNLIPYPYSDKTKTINGVTFTDNGDGSIMVNGTATADTLFFLKREAIIHTGTYTLTGCPKSGSATTYCQVLGSSDYRDFGNGITRTYSADVKPNVFIKIYSGYTANNLVFKPQLETGSVITEFEPYMVSEEDIILDTPLIPYEYIDIINQKRIKEDGTVEDIIVTGNLKTVNSDVNNIIIKTETQPSNIEIEYVQDLRKASYNVEIPMTVNEQQVISCEINNKNFVSKPRRKYTVGTVNGTSCICDKNGIITVDGTASANSFYNISQITLPKGDYYFSSGVNGGKLNGTSSTTYQLYLENISTNPKSYVYNGEGYFSLNQDSTIMVKFMIYKDVTVQNLQCYPYISRKNNKIELLYSDNSIESTAISSYSENTIFTVASNQNKNLTKISISDMNYLDIKKLKSENAKYDENGNLILPEEKTNLWAIKNIYFKYFNDVNGISYTNQDFEDINDIMTIGVFQEGHRYAVSLDYEIDQFENNGILLRMIDTNGVEIVSESSSEKSKGTLLVTNYFNFNVDAIVLDNKDSTECSVKLSNMQIRDITYDTNLIQYPYNSMGVKTFTTSGVTFRDNENGTISMNGKTIDDISMFISKNKLAKGEYKVTGCPVSGSSNTYNLCIITYKEDGSISTQSYDYGKGCIFNTTIDNQRVDIYLEIKQGISCDNLISYPILSKSNAKNVSFYNTDFIEYSTPILENNYETKGILVVNNAKPMVAGGKTHVYIKEEKEEVYKTYLLSGNNFVKMNLTPLTNYCVEYLSSNENARKLAINANFTPDTVSVYLDANLYSGDDKNPSTGTKIGTITIKVPRFLLNGTQEISMSMTGAANTPFEGSALAAHEYGCEGEGVYAEIVEIQEGWDWNNLLIDIMIDGGDDALWKANSIDDLSIYGLYGSSYTPKKLNNDDFEFIFDNENIINYSTPQTVDGQIPQYEGINTRFIMLKSNPNINYGQAYITEYKTSLEDFNKYEKTGNVTWFSLKNRILSCGDKGTIIYNATFTDVENKSDKYLKYIDLCNINKNVVQIKPYSFNFMHIDTLIEKDNLAYEEIGHNLIIDEIKVNDFNNWSENSICDSKITTQKIDSIIGRIILSKDIEVIPSSNFLSFMRIENINLNNIKEIQDSSYYGFEINNFELGNTIVSIGSKSIIPICEEIILPSSLQSVSLTAFGENNSYVKSIYIQNSPDNSLYIENSPWGCPLATIIWCLNGFKRIYIEKNTIDEYNLHFIGDKTNNSIITLSMITNLLKTYDVKSIFISGVKEVEALAFSNQVGIAKISFEDEIIEKIGENAFIGTSSDLKIFFNKKYGEIKGTPWGTDTAIIRYNQSVSNKSGVIPLKFENAAKGENLLNCKIMGNCGKNLIPYPYVNISVKANGITYTNNGDGTITANGTATANSEYKFLSEYKVDYPAGNYIFSCSPKGGRYSTYRTEVAFASKVAASGWDIINSFDYGDGLKITANNGIGKLYGKIFIRSGATVNNLVFKPQLEVGSEITEYEKYKAVGNLSSTDNKYHIPIQVCGKNLIPVDPEITWVGTLYRNVILPQGTYTLSWSASTHGGQYPVAVAFPNNATSIYLKTSPSKITLKKAETEVQIYANGYSWNDSEGITSSVNNLMLEFGNTATEYEKYNYSIVNIKMDTPLSIGENVDIITKTRTDGYKKQSTINIEGQLKTVSDNINCLTCNTEVIPKEVFIEYTTKGEQGE